MRQVADQLGLERLTHILEMLNGIVTIPFLPLEWLIPFDDFPHFRLDFFEVFVEGCQFKPMPQSIVETSVAAGTRKAIAS